MSNFNSISINGVPLNGLAAQPQQVFPNHFANIGQWNITCHPDIKQLLPQIASFIHNYIAQRATQNLPRAVHFNMLVTQGNPELFILTTLIANMAYIRVVSKQIPDIQQAITQCVEWAVARRVNFITINVPDLFNQCQSEAQSINQMANEYVMEANATSQAMSQIYMGGTTGFNNNQQQQAQQGGFAMGPATGFGGGNQNNMGGFSGGAPAMGFGSSGGQNNRSMGGVIVRAMDNAAPQGDRFSNDLGMTAAEPTQQKQASAPAEAPRPSVMEQMERGLNPAEHVKAEDKPIMNDKGELQWGNLKPIKAPWTQSRFQHHPIMFDGNRFDINRRGFSLEGKNIVVDTLKKAPVDRKALSLPVAAQFLSEIKPDGKNRVEFREESLINAASVVKLVREQTTEAEYLERAEEMRTVGFLTFKNPMSSLAEAISVARQAAMMVSKHEFGAFTAEFHMNQDFVLFKEDALQLKDLSRNRTLATLVESMQTIIQDPHTSHTLRVAVVQLNFYLAQCWMEWLRFYIALDDFSGSNSFIDDVLAMRDDISDIAGEHFRKLVDRNQQRFIQTYLAFGEVETSELNLVEDPNKDAAASTREVVTVPIKTPSMVICTEFLDSEYNLISSADLDGRDVGCTFDESSTSPALRKLVTTLVEQPRSIGLQSQIRRFYIATLDGVVYEVNIGLNETAAPLLIKKVK